MTKKIRLGLVGAGGFAKSHSDAIKKSANCILAAVVDTNIERAEEMAAAHGARAYRDYKKMDCTDLDAVILNLPHYLHCEITVYFLEKGLHVLCEKPMANTLEECDRMIEAARRTKKILAIGHVQKYYTATREVKKIIEEERFGKLVMINEVRSLNYLEKRPAWFLKKQTAGGGIAMNLGAHSIDRIFFTTGLSVEEVQANTQNFLSDDDIETSAHIFLKLSGGVSATVTLCGANVPAEHESTYYFTNGVVKIRGAELFVYEDSKYKSYGGSCELIPCQLEEFIKLLRGEESEMVTFEYGREIIRILKQFI